MLTDVLRDRKAHHINNKIPIDPASYESYLDSFPANVSRNSFIPLKKFPGYIIEVNEPHRIVKEDIEFTPKESINNAGYIQIAINSQPRYKHRIVAEQFVPNPNPDEFTEVDHIDGNPLNNRIDNLRWVTHKENCLNRNAWRKGPSEFADQLPEGSIHVTEWKGYVIDYWISPSNDVWRQSGKRYRKLRVAKGTRGINIADSDKHEHQTSVLKFISSARERFQK